MHRHQGIVLWLALLSSGCSKPDETPVGECGDVLSGIEGRSPNSEAKLAIDNGDRRFLAVNEFTIVFPGVPDDKLELVDKQGYRAMPKTSDAIEDESCEVYQTEATRFAEAYNAEIINSSAKSH